MYWTNLDQIFGFGRAMGRIINLTFVLRSSKGHCYGNQLIFGVKEYAWLIPPSIFASAFQNELEYRNADARVNSGDDFSTSDRNLANSCLATPEFTRFNSVQQVSVTTRVSLTAFATGWAALPGTAAISTHFCLHRYSLVATLLCRAGYTLGSATLVLSVEQVHNCTKRCNFFQLRTITFTMATEASERC